MIQLPTIPMRAGELTVSAVIDLYMSYYTGRDSTRPQRLRWWGAKIGTLPLQEITDDHIHAALEGLAQQSATYYAGDDAGGKPIYRSKRRSLAPATINRYSASVSAVFTWAIRRRVAPKGWVHPCRSVERRPENNEQTRFLSDDERTRLLLAAKGSRWPGLYPLVLLALTTGARKGELLGLRMNDIDLERRIAYVGRTKNGDPRVLPLVPNVVEALTPILARIGPSLLFRSSRSEMKPYALEAVWGQAKKAAKIRNFRFHDLRHSCASMLC